MEAAEVVFSGVGGIGANELLDEAVQAVQPACFQYEERRSRSEWGASGPEIQEVVINFSAGLASSATVSAIAASLKSLRDRREKDGRAQGRLEIKMVGPADDAKMAWHYFGKHLRTAYRVSEPHPVEIRQLDNGWYLSAEADGIYNYEGTVDQEGRVICSRRIDGFTERGA